MERQTVNQSTAARSRGVSRQRISELYAKGRFTIPVDSEGNQIKGAIYLDEVESMSKGKRGRPKLTDEERARRGLDAYKVGDVVTWLHKPRDGHGFELAIKAEVERVGMSRVLLRFKNGEGQLETTWVNKSLCVLLARPMESV